MKRLVFVLLVFAALIAAIALLYPRGSDETAAGGDAEGSEVGKKSAEERDRPSLLPQEFPEKETAEGDPKPSPPSRFGMVIQPEPALSGLEISTASEDDRKRAGVTAQYGQGVTVGHIHPDSSAAEVGLESGDVIVRAQKENVNSVDDLKRIVGDRDHTVVNFMRQGQLLSVVLQKPYQKPTP